jgi:hypothetical protein
MKRRCAMKRSSFRWLVGGLMLAALAFVQPLRAQSYMEPTKQHEEMAHEEGVWDAEVTMWEKPDSEPTKSKAVETNKMLGKMWLLSEFEGEFAGEKFTGHGHMGYDPIKKKYVGAWIDTMSPFMWTMEGDYQMALGRLAAKELVEGVFGKRFRGEVLGRLAG